MRLVERVRLRFRQGSSDKAYEVDLCEVGPDLFVVNFRYGRSGTRLREGTKTDAPVSLARARKVFDDLVGEKSGKGYLRVEEPGGALDASAEASSGASADPTAAHDPDAVARAPRLIARLGRGDRGDEPLGRVVWKVGVLRLRQAESVLVELLAVSARQPDHVRTYTITWALGRCGSSKRAVEALEAVVRDEMKPRWVRDLAEEAIREAGGPSVRNALVAREVGALPAELRQAHGAGDAARFEATLIDLLDGGRADAWDAVMGAYRIDDAVARPAVLAFARRAATGRAFQRLRALYKAAELRGDGELFGIIGHRFETTPASASWQGGRAFTSRTRRYLRRRTARTLRRLGQNRLPEFVPMAIGVLLAFRDEDAGELRLGAAVWDRWASYWAFNYLLYRNGRRYRPDRGGRAWRVQPGAIPGDPPSGREEAFPELWQARPEGLLELLRRSRCEPVHDMAARAIRSRPDFLAARSDAELIDMLGQPYAATNLLGLDLAAARPLGGELLRALLDCRLASARALAHRWIDGRRTQIYRDSELLARLVTARFADTRAFALEYLRAIDIDEPTARLVIARVVAELMGLGTSDEDEERGRDAGATLLRVFPGQLAAIAVDVVGQLARHPARSVQELAGEILLGHATLSTAVPEQLLEALLDSPHGSVRTIGARLFSRLPDAELAAHPQLLIHFATSAHAELRTGTRALLARLAGPGGDPELGGRVAADLGRALLRKLPEGAPAHVLSLLRNELAGARPALDADEVLRLVRALSPHAQEAGGLFLAGLDPDELELSAIVQLASHDVLAVREACWSLCRRSVGRLRLSMAALARVVDSKWEDSRRFGVELLREVGGDRIGPEVLVAICDSVRPEVQAIGRELIARTFEDEHGVEYLMRLSEHPSPGLQLFVSAFLEAYAAGRPERVQRLEGYLRAVLSQVNRGAVAKRRVLAFLRAEAARSAESAAIIAPILAWQSATMAVGDKARLIAAMVEVAERHPDIAQPIAAVEVERRAL